MSLDLTRAWRVEDAARALHLSSRQLQRALGAHQTSFSEVLQRVRLDAACAMMQAPSLSLTEIAFCTGFADLAHMSRLFRRQLDVPPSTYRELVLANMSL